MDKDEKVRADWHLTLLPHWHYQYFNPALGGKAKPLKAPKKEKKELDEDEIAFREKQKAGMTLSPIFAIHYHGSLTLPCAACSCKPTITNFIPSRRQSQEGAGGKGKGQRPDELGTTGNQEIWEEIEHEGATSINTRYFLCTLAIH